MDQTQSSLDELELVLPQVHSRINILGKVIVKRLLILVSVKTHNKDQLRAIRNNDFSMSLGRN